MSVGGWALLGFALWGTVELLREVDFPKRARAVVMAASAVCLAVAWSKHIGVVP